MWQETKDHALAEGVTSYIKNSHAIGWVPGANDHVPVPSLDDEEVRLRTESMDCSSDNACVYTIPPPSYPRRC